MKYYAIKSGRKTGIFNSWTEAEGYVKGFPNAKYKSFTSIEEAEEYLGNLNNNDNTDVNQIISKERNKYFHWEKFEPSIFLDETALVEDEETARAIIVNCLTQIEKYYTIFNQS
ncbi:TPA: RNase H1/viroplasmin domain-containing protein [Streptococcus suis]|nr:RNase H1/viroplasmin domain-containing protein [Streptococcus suis]